jgi:hypothetical protein
MRYILSVLVVSTLLVGAFTVPAMAQPVPGPPKSCEQGQLTATENHAAPGGPSEQFVKHLRKGQACLLNHPPGEGHFPPIP